MSGTGTVIDPFIITDCAQLNHVNVAPDASYLVQDNFDCDGVDVTPVNNFTGQYFDGANYYISNLHITDAENDNVGLFRQIAENSIIENLRLSSNAIDTTGNESPDLTVGLVAGINNGTMRNVTHADLYYSYALNSITTRGVAGGLAGINNGTIQTSNMGTNFIPLEGANNIFGGIAGINTGTIEDVSSNSFLNTASTTVTNAKCGGLVGHLDGGNISRSIATGTLRCDGTSPSGGLVGLATGASSITDSIAKNANGSLALKGAIVGSNPENIDLSTTYYDGNLLANETCDDSGNTTCNKIVQVGYFHIKTSPVYQNWDINSDGGTWLDPYDYSGDRSNYYLPRPNSDYNSVAFPVEITKVQATETTAKFKWKNKYHSCYCNYYRDTSYDIYVGIVPADAQGDQIEVSYEFVETVEKTSDQWWDEYTYEVTDLDPSVYYDYIIIPRTSAGEGPQSDSIEIRSVPQKLSTPEVISTFSGALRIQWNNISNIAQRYTVEYKKSTDSTWISRTTGNFPASNSTIYPLEGNTSYDFRVSASNLRGTGEVSDVLTASTISQNIYEISTCEDLQSINDDLFGHYTLTQDIDCAASNDWNDGQGFIPIGLTDDVLQSLQDGAGLDTIIAFQGTLDGQGNTISQLHVNLQGITGGLFAFIDGATVKDLTLDGGNVLGSSANNGTVYTDSPMTMVAGGLAALAANSSIDNVTTDIDIPSNNVDGHVGLSAGLIGGVMPSAFGPDSLETSVSITNSHALGDTSGYITAGLIGAIIPADGFSLSTVDVNGLEDPENMQSTLANIGTRIDVTISDSTTSGDLKCSILCGGIVGINGSNLTISNVARSGNIGTFEKEMSDISEGMFSIIEMFGPVSAGAVGVNLPMSFNEIPALLTISDTTIDGSINGTATAGLIGISGPGIMLAFDDFINAYYDWGQSDDKSDEQLLDLIYSALDHVSLTKSFDVTNTDVNAENNCVILCTGASLVNLGDGIFDNVDINGNISIHDLGETASNYGETFSMISMFGPISAGFVGLNMPITTSESGIGLAIKNSEVKSDLSGTATSGLVGFSLPGISVSVQQFEEYFTPFWRVITGQLGDDYSDQYGNDWYDNEELNSQYVAELVSNMANFTGFAMSVIANSPGLTVLDTSVEGDISCSIACSGVAGISLAKTLIDGFTQVGNLVNDNAQFLFEGNPVGMCPIQITGGVIGSQLLLPLEVKNTSVMGDITVNQAGTLPEDSVASLVDSIFNPTEEEQNNGGIFGTESLIRLGCAAGSSLLQGTGGITGSYFNPVDLSEMVDGTAGFAPGTSSPWVNKISDTLNQGNITSNSHSATGGLIGLTLGKSEINNSQNTGDITNSTFAEMFRTPIASAATGGLVGHSIGTLAADGDATTVTNLIWPLLESGNFDDVINIGLEISQAMHLTPVSLDIEASSSTGDVVSSNTAGGLIGTASNGARVHKSFATGDVYGVTAGGLLGSGFNMGSPLGILDMFSTLEISNSYARGNIVASDAENTFTFAGGLVGFMAHLGEFKISNSYSSGDISILNDATNTRLVAGGFVGSELDLSFISQLAEILVEKSNSVSIGDESIDPYIQMVSLYGSNGLVALEQLGIPFKSGFSVTNSFTTSHVPQSTPFDKDTLLQEIGSGMPEQGVTSGALFGFAFSIDSQEMSDLIDNALGTLLDSEPGDLEGESLLDSALFEDAMDALTEFNWKDSSALAPNSFYDGSKVETDSCANSLPTTSELVTILLPKIATAMSGEEGGAIDYFSFIPPINELGGTECVSVNAAGSNPNYFKNNTSVAPLTAWDFNSIWEVQHNDFPTFVNDPSYVPDNGGDTTTPPGADTPNPDTGGPASFVPKKITKTTLDKTISKVKALLVDKPATKVLPKILKDVGEKLDAEASGLKKDSITDDKGLLGAVIGIFSATGAFLLRNMATVLMLLVTGSMLVLYGRKKKEFDLILRKKQ